MANVAEILEIMASDSQDLLAVRMRELLEKIRVARVRRSEQLLLANWKISQKPQGSYRWQRRTYIRIYLQDENGHDIRLSDGTYSIWKSEEFLDHRQSGIRKDQREDYGLAMDFAEAVCQVAN